MLNWTVQFKRFPSHFRLACCGAFMLLMGAPPSVMAEKCSKAEVVATAVSIQGVVEVRVKSSTMWKKITVQETFCTGDMIRTQANSRAGIFLSNNTILRLNQHSAVTFSGPPHQAKSWLDLKQGMAHFISRIKQRFEVTTPYVNAAVDGTEFVIAVSNEQVEVTVLEGRVRAINDQGEINLGSSEAVVVRSGEAPALRTHVQPWSAVSWALHYPVITDFTTLPAAQLPEPWSTALTRSIAHYRAGEIPAALTALTLPSDDFANDLISVYRAGLYLMAGQVTPASSDLENALKLNPANGEAIALKAIIAVINNQTEQALTLADKAIQASPEAFAPLLAKSYAQQAAFNLQQALATAERAVNLAPKSALTWARLAELRLMFGAHGPALEAAQRAAEIAPDLARVQTVLGFAHLTRIDIYAAIQTFHQAIQLDQSDPLPRLGLGLAVIRRGELESGRRQIEYAASLDPANPLIRSYLGKAYYEEKRPPLAADQLTMAKALDPNDPTPWFYDAIRKQSENRPIEALQDLQHAIKLNDNRAIYRSRLLLDKDAAARSTSLARLYMNLGAGQLAMAETWKSPGLKQNNSSAHRLLSEVYAGVPRHEVARASEVLQAQLLQPLSHTPTSPQLAEGSLYLVDNAGPTTASYNEFNPLFTRNRMSLMANGILGNNNTQGDELVFSALHNRLSYSIGQFQYKTDGFRQNNDLTHDIYNLFAQYEISPRLSTQIEVRRKQSAFGDLELRFDPDDFRSTKRQVLNQDSVRFGLYLAPTTQQRYLVSIMANDFESGLKQGSRSENKQHSGMQSEIQHIFSAKQLTTTFGVGYLRSNAETTDIIDLSPFFFEKIITERDIEQKNTYFYAQIINEKRDILTFGFSYDDVNEKNGVNRKQINPKLGLQLMPNENTTLRMAVFKTLARKILSNQTIEPTQVAGFNQLFEDNLGTNAIRYGVAADHQISPHLFVGAELTGRSLTTLVNKSGVLIPEEQNERSHRMYLNFMPQPTLAVGVSYHFEDFSRKSIAGEANADIPAFLNSQSLPFELNYSHPSGFSSNITTTYVNQQIQHATVTGFDKAEDHFWVTDASFAYLLPKRRGKIEFALNNMFNKTFQFQSTNFISNEKRQSPFNPERAYYLTVDLQF